MSNLELTTLPYESDLIAHYQILSDLPGFALLESSDKQRGRYDILTAYPYHRIQVGRDKNAIQSAFKNLKSMLVPVDNKCNLPFQGGAIGYIAYDVGEILAGIDSKPHPLNDIPVINLSLYDWAIVVDHQCKSVTLVAANTQPETTTLVQEIKERWQGACEKAFSFILRQAFTPLVSEQDYHHAFNAIHENLRHGRSYQVNYTQPFLGHYEGSTWEMYKRIRAKNPVPYAAFLHWNEEDIISFSPERFIKVENGYVLTSPIKGTAKRSVDPIIDKQLRDALMASSKDHAENVMIVDLLRNDLGKFAIPGSVKVTSLCEIQSFNSVHHLVSDIEAQYSPDISPLQIFEACFPGGSITGAPKLESMRIINEHEPYGRGVYCGSVVYFSSHGSFDSNIAIRTITAKEESLYLSAGGAIVIDSKWQDEYRECFTKIAAIVKSIGVAEH